MKTSINPFMPHTDTPKEEILYNDALQKFNEITTETKTCLNKLPKDFDFIELNINKDADEILSFINKYYDGVTYDSHTIKYLQLVNAVPYCVKYKNVIIAVHIIEYIDIEYNGETLHAVHIDFGVVHTKFRKKFLYNVFTAMIYGEVCKRGISIEFWGTHTNLHIQSYIVKSLYNLPLSELTFEVNLTCRHAYKIKPTLCKLYTPTLEQIRKLNSNDYKLKIKYTDTMLNAMLSEYVCYCDSENSCNDDTNILIFVPLCNVNLKVSIQTVILINYRISNKNNFNTFFNSALNDLKQRNIDLVSFTLTDNEFLIDEFGFEKNSEMYYYMINFLPKVKRNEVMLSLR